MTGVPGPGRGQSRRAVEASAAGLAYGAALCLAGVCLLGSFRPGRLSTPYWSGLPGLRSDTAGIAAFLVVAVCGTLSEYLRLSGSRRVPRTPGWALTRALSSVVAVLSGGLVLYLSVNAITHPATLALHLTHLAPWPAEGTTRVIGLVAGVISAGVWRYTGSLTTFIPNEDQSADLGLSRSAAGRDQA
jgi:hypothetical protein